MRTRTDVLMSMTDEELKNIFLSNGGNICAEEFSVPVPTSFETSEAYCAYQILSERTEGRKILLALQKAFCKGEIDSLGRKLSQAKTSAIAT